MHVRLLKRKGLQRRVPSAAVADEASLRSVFDDEAASTPGFIHIDSFVLSGSQHCFVAIDRATRMVYLQVVERHDSDAACAGVAEASMISVMTAAASCSERSWHSMAWAM
jgi:hypothetical protein